MTAQVFTPPEVAKLWRCHPASVVRHIREGTLRAFDVAHEGSKRPRFRITTEAIADFQRRNARRGDVGSGQR